MIHVNIYSIAYKNIMQFMNNISESSAGNFMHKCYSLPAVVILRSTLFPLMVKQRRNMVNLNNHLPTVTRLQERISDAKRDGNKYEG